MKVVITGSASCGKTCLLKELSERGFKIVGDNARAVLEERKSYAPVRGEVRYRQTEIIRRQVLKEEEIEDLEEPVFLEYGLIDTLVYTKHLINETIEIDHDLLKGYDFIFILERLPFIQDGVRVEKNDKEAIEVQNKIFDAYVKVGYKPIIVPVLSVKERADFVLEKVGIH